MVTRRGNFESTSRRELSANLGEVRGVGERHTRFAGDVFCVGERLAAKVPRDLEDVLRDVDPKSRNRPGFGRIGARHDGALPSLTPTPEQRGQHSAHAAHLAAYRELPEHNDAFERLFRNHAECAEHGTRDGDVKSAAALF